MSYNLPKEYSQVFEYIKSTYQRTLGYVCVKSQGFWIRPMLRDWGHFWLQDFEGGGSRGRGRKQEETHWDRKEDCPQQQDCREKQDSSVCSPETDAAKCLKPGKKIKLEVFKELLKAECGPAGGCEVPGSCRRRRVHTLFRFFFQEYTYFHLFILCHFFFGQSCPMQTNLNNMYF